MYIWSRDMTKHKIAMISNFHDFERKIRQILQNSKNWRNNIFMFIDVSPKIFELQRCTIPHFKAWNKLIWPFVIHFSTKSDISWSAEQNTCPILFAPDFRYSVLWKKYTINLSSPICLLPLICMFISYVVKSKPCFISIFFAKYLLN